VELSQSKAEQQQYLRNVELARVLDKRTAQKKEKGEEFELKLNPQPKKRVDEDRPRMPVPESVLQNIFA
jgi:ESF2/ABP1 family protein